MSTVLDDLRYTMRQMANSPGFAIVAILTLTLGIGANSDFLGGQRGAAESASLSAARIALSCSFARRRISRQDRFRIQTLTIGVGRTRVFPA